MQRSRLPLGTVVGVLVCVLMTARPVGAQAVLKYLIANDGTGGDCPAIGTWDDIAKTCTLTGDVVDTSLAFANLILIRGTGITLESPLVPNPLDPEKLIPEFTVRNPGGRGVALDNTVNAKVRNLRVRDCNIAILIAGASNNILEGNICTNNSRGIRLQNTTGNRLTRNRSDALLFGFELFNSTNNLLEQCVTATGTGAFVDFLSHDNRLVGNTFNTNASGIQISESDRNELSGNTCKAKVWGILLTNADGTMVVGNDLAASLGSAIDISGGSGNTVRNNTMSASSNGIIVRNFSTGNTVFNNNFLRNSNQASVSVDSTGTVFHVAAPSGGNHWDAFDTSAEGCDDADANGFCDVPFTFSGGQDDLPWTVQDGWVVDSDPPFVTITAPADGTVIGATSVAVLADVTDASETAVVSTPGGINTSLPAGGGSVNGIVPLLEGPNTITVTATDGGTGISLVSLAAGGDQLTTGSTASFDPPETSATLSGTEDTTRRLDGPLTLTATAHDAAGNEAIATVTLTVDNIAPSKILVSPTDGESVSDVIEILTEAADLNLESIEIIVDGSSLGISAPSPFSVFFDTNTRLDGAMTVTAIARDQAGNSTTCTAVVTVDNVSVVLHPAVVNLGSRAPNGRIRAVLEGTSLALLLPVEANQVELRVPGGNAVPAVVGFDGDDQLFDEDLDGIPDMTVAFDRATLRASIQAGIAAGLIAPDSVVKLTVVAGGGFEIGSDTMKIKGAG